jgi:hypothetical protein
MKRDDKMDQRIFKGIEQLRDLRQEHHKLGLLMHQAAPHVYGTDLLALAVLNRSVIVIEGFCTLLEAKNYLCAAPLVRFQLDSMLRFFATTLVDNSNDLSLTILRGTPVRNLQDRDGKYMTDHYLLKKIAALYVWAPRVYEHSSGFIHLSEKHILHTIRDAKEDGADRTIKIAVTHDDEHIPVLVKLEAIECLYTETEAVLELVANWVDAKHESRSTPTKQPQQRPSGQAPAATS